MSPVRNDGIPYDHFIVVSISSTVITGQVIRYLGVPGTGLVWNRLNRLSGPVAFLYPPFRI
jgi:hypothetical protein